MNWKNIYMVGVGLILVGIGVIVGLYLTDESIRNYVISSLPLILSVGVMGLVIEMVGILWGLIEKRETKKLAHSEKMLNNLRLLAKTDIGFENEHSICDLCIQINNLPNTQEYKMYSDNVDAHLKSGYHDKVWAYIEKRNSDILQYNIDLQVFSEQLISDILSNIKHRIPTEWDSSHPTESKRYFVRNNIRSDLMEAIRNNCKTHTPILASFSGSNILYIRNQGVVSDDEKELKEIKEMIESKFNGTIIDKQFSVLKNRFKLLKEDGQGHIIREIGNIIKDLESGTPLKGKCGIATCGGKK